ncbi:MAG: GIY-YIG nuclease family protein [Alphaproteobacteria bacterium]|nr:GIY-YIG nuclease family protein [Alphaproteobacteria bacterium]
MKQPAVYILTNKKHGTLYTGVTSNLVERIYKHKHNQVRSFAAKYGCKNLVYYEVYEDMLTAIAREKQIKAGSRSDKIKLIEKTNPEWKDLFHEICG